jgi:hypothetical protein
MMVSVQNPHRPDLWGFLFVWLLVRPSRCVVRPVLIHRIPVRVDAAALNDMCERRFACA